MSRLHQLRMFIGHSLTHDLYDELYNDISKDSIGNDDIV